MKNQAKAITPVAVPTVNPIPSTPKATLERDLEGLVMAAAQGDTLAQKLLKPAILRMAKASTTYIEDAENVTQVVLMSLGHPVRGVGKPRPGSAVAWLENVTRYYANHDFELRSFEEWEAWEGDDEETEPE